MGDTKRCTCCGEEKALDAFQRSAKGPKGRQSWCRECFALRDMHKDAKRRSLCGNGKLCRSGCTRHSCYKGKGFHLPNQRHFMEWSRSHYRRIIAAGGKPSADRIDDARGYECFDTDKITKNRYGNVQIIPLKENVQKAAARRKRT